MPLYLSARIFTKFPIKFVMHTELPFLYHRDMHMKALPLLRMNLRPLRARLVISDQNELILDY